MKKIKVELRILKILKQKVNLINLFSIALVFTLINSIEAQNQPPKLLGETSDVFSDLLKVNHMVNFKSGLICSAQRNDTVFAIFYNTLHNNILCVELGCLGDSSDINCYESDQESAIFRKLRNPSGILCSKYVAEFKMKNEIINVFSQTLTQHIILREREDFNLSIKMRTIFYSNKKGIYNIEYSNEYVEDKPYFQWPYLEGDFIF